MSNPPMNISPKNVAGKCDLKCSYSFKYSESNSTAKNNGVFITLSYDSRSVPPVSYNHEKYTVSSIMITSPSLHYFNDASMPGEILIEHVPVKGGNNLMVCIPFLSSSETSKASAIITDIIKIVSSNAPSEGDSTNLNIPLNLQSIVPRKSYFAYSTGTNDYIVFGALDAIPLTSSTITTLQQIIKPFPMMMPSASLFYNAKGPVAGLQIGNGLYISCQPTGSSTDETEVTYDKDTSSTVDLSSILNSPIFKYIVLFVLGCILFILIFYGISAFFAYLSGDAIKMPLKSISTFTTTK